MNDRGSIVIGWLTRLAIAFALLGVVAYDGFMVLTASFGASDDATTAANAAADAYRSSKNVQAAYDAAVSSVEGKGDAIETKTFTIDAEGRVTLTVDRTPKTLWMHYVGPLQSWTHVHQTGTGTPGS